MTSKVKGQKGFTLIELLIVVVIIGILAAIAIPRFGETRERAYVSAMQSDLNQLVTAQEMFYQDNEFEYGDEGDFDIDADGETGDNSPITLSEGVRVDDITTVGGGGEESGWSAVVSHVATDRLCGYFTGGADEPTGIDADMEPGVVTCDEPEDDTT